MAQKLNSISTTNPSNLVKVTEYNVKISEIEINVTS